MGIGGKWGDDDDGDDDDDDDDDDDNDCARCRCPSFQQSEKVLCMQRLQSPTLTNEGGM